MADTDPGTAFDGAVVPEATPSPRTIRFATPPLDDGPSRAFDATNAGDDARVARIFATSDGVTNVLVGPAFVAVTILHADDWEQLLDPLLRAVTDAFAGGPSTPRAGPVVDTVGPRAAATGPGARTEPRAVERAWTDLGTERLDGDGLDRIVAAADDADPARRQVAAVRLADADAEVALRHWTRLLADPSRSVRRVVVDTVGDAGRPELRPLLELGLQDPDAWIRWRSVRGLAAIGVDPSREAVDALAGDPDFRVRLEAARVLAGG